MNKRKICFVITSPIHYSRNKLILESISKNKDLELQIVVAASAILPRYGDIQGEIVEDGFKIDSKIIMTLEGSSNVSMAKTTGIGVTEFATVFENLNPDIVVIRGDRYEIMSAAKKVIGEHSVNTVWHSTRHGVPVDVFRFRERGAMIAFLADTLEDLAIREPLASVAVLARTQETAQTLFEGLQKPILRICVT